MTKLRFLLIGLLSLSVVACQNGGSETAKNKAINPELVSSQVIVKFNRDASDQEIQSVIGGFAKSEVIDSTAQVFLVSDSQFSGIEKESAAKLSSFGSVEFAEPNFKSKAFLKVPQDPMWLGLWGLKNYGQDAPAGVEGKVNADIGALKAWETTQGSKKVTVVVLDTGVDYNHPDLKKNMWVNQKEKDGIPGLDDDGNGYVDDLHGFNFVSDAHTQPHFGVVGQPDPMDDHSHGTHVAGTIGAVGGNGVGIVGVNWNVSIVAVKLLDANGSTNAIDQYRAFKYIAANKFDVVNGSYGGGEPSQLLKMAIEEAGKNGTLFVFASGNSTQNTDVTPSYPANYDIPQIISVAATDSRDRLASFSNFGLKTVDIAAPGENILSTIPLAMAPKGQAPYAAFSGTSMAAPHVAGAAGLLLAAAPELKGQPVKLKERLLSSVVQTPSLGAFVSSGGRLSIDRAIAGDVNTLNDFAQWKTVDYELATPAFPTERIDDFWTVEIPEAKAIRVHIKLAQVESGFDQAHLYDGEFRHIMPLVGTTVDTWSPAVVGNKIHLKFSNAMVSVKNGEPFANFNSEGVVIDRVEYLEK